MSLKPDDPYVELFQSIHNLAFNFNSIPNLWQRIYFWGKDHGKHYDKEDIYGALGTIQQQV